MPGAGVIDVLIGLILVYLVLSLVCSGVNEWITSALGKRARFLEEGIANLLGRDKDLKEAFFSSPLVRGLGRRGSRPSYIPARTFSLAVLERWLPSALASGRATRETLTEVVSQLQAVPSPDLRHSLGVLLRECGGDLERFRQGIEGWFDDAMDRVSGWYKRHVRRVLFVIAAIVAVVLNADTIQIARTLWVHSTVRAAVVAQAEAAVQGRAGGETAGISRELAALETIPLPLGWVTGSPEDPRNLPTSPIGLLTKALGLALTAVALTLGAPFWFDTLGRVLSIRSSGRPPSRERPATQERVVAVRPAPVPEDRASVAAPRRSPSRAAPRHPDGPRQQAVDPSAAWIEGDGGPEGRPDARLGERSRDDPAGGEDGAASEESVTGVAHESGQDERRRSRHGWRELGEAGRDDEGAPSPDARGRKARRGDERLPGLERSLDHERRSGSRRSNEP